MFKSKWQKKYEEAMLEIDSWIDLYRELSTECTIQGRYADAHNYMTKQKAMMEAYDILMKHKNES